MPDISEKVATQKVKLETACGCSSIIELTIPLKSQVLIPLIADGSWRVFEKTAGRDDHHLPIYREVYPPREKKASPKKEITRIKHPLGIIETQWREEK